MRRSLGDSASGPHVKALVKLARDCCGDRKLDGVEAYLK